MSLHHQDRHTERHTSYSTYELAPRAAKHWSNHFSLKHHLHFVSVCSQFEAQGFMQSGLAFFHFDKQAFLFPKEAWQSSLHRHSSWASSLPQHWATSRTSLMTSYAQGIQHRWAGWYNQRVYIKENVPASAGNSTTTTSAAFPNTMGGLTTISGCHGNHIQWHGHLKQ